MPIIARELGADEDEGHWVERLSRIAKAKPQSSNAPQKPTKPKK